MATPDADAVAQRAEPSPRELRLLRRAALSGNADEIDRARREFPDNKDILKYSGILYYQKKELVSATATLAKAMAIDPSDTEAALFLMRAYYIADNQDECVNIAEHLLMLSPDHPDALRTLGRIYNRRRSWDKAASAWQRLALAMPDDSEASLQAARCYERLHRHAETLLFADKALAVDPGCGEAARIKIDAAIAGGDGDHGPLVDTIPAYYRMEPTRALRLIQQLARSERIEGSAAMVAALLAAYPGDQNIGGLATALAATWALKAERAQLQGEDRTATSYAAALNIIGPASTDAVAFKPAAAATQHPASGEGSGLTGPEAFRARNPSPDQAPVEKPAARLLSVLASGAAWVLPSKQALLRQAQRLQVQGDAEAVRNMLPRLLARAGRNASYLRSIGYLAVAVAAWPAATDAWSRLRAELPDDEDALLHLARCHAASGAHKEATEAAAALLAHDPKHAEAMQIHTKALLTAGMIDDAAAAAAGLIAASPTRALAWLAGQPEIWTPLVGAAAFSRNASVGSPELVQAADRAGVDYLGNGYGHEIDGDFVAAFIAFHAAALLRPADRDAALGVARVRNECRAQLGTGEASATALTPPVAATLHALCEE